MTDQPMTAPTPTTAAAHYPAPASAEEQQRLIAEVEKMAEGPTSPDDGFDWLGDPADEVPITDPELLAHFVAQLREVRPSFARTIALRLYVTLLAARRENEDRIWRAYRLGYVDGITLPISYEELGYEKMIARAEAGASAHVAALAATQEPR